MEVIDTCSGSLNDSWPESLKMFYSIIWQIMRSKSHIRTSPTQGRTISSGCVWFGVKHVSFAPSGLVLGLKKCTVNTCLLTTVTFYFFALNPFSDGVLVCVENVKIDGPTDRQSDKVRLSSYLLELNMFEYTHAYWQC